MFYPFFDPTIIVLIPALIFSMWAQFKVKGAFAKYSEVRAMSGVSAEQVSRMLLDRRGLTNVKIERVPGELTDHYDPRSKVLRLSDSVNSSRSIAAIGVAAHEVGHAMVTALQKNTEPVQKITIVPRTMGALGYVMQVPEEEKYLNTQKELEAMLVGYLGGRAAEELVFDSVTTGASNDIEQATKVARAMITQYGMSKKFGLMGLATQENQYLNGRAVLNCGDNTATEVDHEVMELLRVSYEEAKRLISSHRKALDKIAAYLIRKETITGKEFMIIFRAVEKGMEVSDVLDAEGLKALDEAVKAEDKTDEANADTETAESTVQAPAEKPAESSGDSEDH